MTPHRQRALPAPPTHLMPEGTGLECFHTPAFKVHRPSALAAPAVRGRSGLVAYREQWLKAHR